MTWETGLSETGERILKGLGMWVMLIFVGWLIFGGSAESAQLTHQWKSPAFSGNGYSAHALTIENQEFSRKKAIKEKKEAEERQRIRDEANTNLAKFMKNVESRIYAQLSKQLVDNMFGTSCDSSTTTCPTSGTSTIEGAQIAWVKDTTTEIITLTITADDGTVTTMAVPIGDFKF